MKAMDTKIEALEKNKTWKLASLSKRKEANWM